ncbi:HK97 gp10 family phage protein [Martelella limonii]|uniref:HK97 gp10 family phage protein n=1 Tax=Martelella limonii TaxID=1647649 RepID=UPI0015812179|nr:HK97 gp10 family phage protein [Martelella limonii]
MVGLDDFANRMNRISIEVERGVDRAVKDCAVAVTSTVINATPVDTGRARSNWTAELDQAFQKLFPAHVPGEKGSTASANAGIAIEKAEAVIEQFDIGKNRSIHISNSLPYIGALNDGHSKQAPADFVKLAIMDGLATVRNAKILKD